MGFRKRPLAKMTERGLGCCTVESRKRTVANSGLAVDIIEKRVVRFRKRTITCTARKI